MINTDSLKAEWIEKAAIANGKADRILVEKVVRALYLLELLKINGLDFIFKGGTALMLMIHQSKRLSIDLDIIIQGNRGNINPLFDKIIKNSDFIEYQEDVREVNSGINKAHHKFFYRPVTNTRTDKEYILLDVLFESSPYRTHVKQIPIASPFIQCDEIKVNVTVPTFDAILGDKLTAYAPNTTGVPYGKNKEIEIIKQLYDIGNLFDQINNLEVVAETFYRIAKTELKYRKLNDLAPLDVLTDIWETSICIATRGKDGRGLFTELQKGIHNIRNFIFSEPFHLERALIPASKAAYLSALIQTGMKNHDRFSETTQITDWTVGHPFNTRLNKLKKTAPEAFFYWHRGCNIL